LWGSDQNDRRHRQAEDQNDGPIFESVNAFRCSKPCHVIPLTISASAAAAAATTAAAKAATTATAAPKTRTAPCAIEAGRTTFAESAKCAAALACGRKTALPETST